MFTGISPFSELLDDISHASTNELDDILKVHRYKDDPISVLRETQTDKYMEEKEQRIF